MTITRSESAATLVKPASAHSQCDFMKLVLTCLDASEIARRRVLAENARWFATTTVGVSGLEESEMPGVARDQEHETKEEASLSPEAIGFLLLDAAVIFDDGMQGGDIEQAADAVVLGAGLLVLAEGFEEEHSEATEAPLRRSGPEPVAPGAKLPAAARAGKGVAA